MNTLPKRYGIIAGSGTLPLTLAQRLSVSDSEPYVIGIEGEFDSSLKLNHFSSLPVERIAYSIPLFKQNNVTHVVLAGGMKRRPRLSSIRVPMVLWPDIPVLAKALISGDDNALSLIVGLFERQKLSVVGAHEILPDHVATFGVIVGRKPKSPLHASIRAGVKAAKTIGTLDIGQAVVALGRRVIAVEGIEGTDQMLARVAALRSEGRINEKAELVLVKVAKPNQELRADMPVIGPATIEGCQKAGIGLICISAGSTMIMDVGQTLQKAKAAGIDIYGIDPDQWDKVPA